MNTGAVIITANESSPANSKIPSYLCFLFFYILYIQAIAFGQQHFALPSLQATSPFQLLGVANACTLVPTVFRWHKKMEFKFHFYFSFFFGLLKWNSISISIFRFWLQVTRKNGFEFRFSFFVFAALSKGDLNFGFCFSFSHHFQNGFEFRFSCFVFASLWKRDFNFVFRTCIACY